MSQEYDEFQQTGAGWWIRVIGVIVYILVIIAYAIQTLQLVNWLFPADNQFMKIVTVFVCDGCATGYAMAEMFYRFRLRKSKHLTMGMWIVTFVLSTVATVIQMYLSSTHNIPHQIDSSVVTIAYGLIIVAFVVNIVAITVIFRLEYAAAQPQQRYLDDKPKRPRVQQPAVQSVSLANTETLTDGTRLEAARMQAWKSIQAAQEPVAQLPAPQPSNLDAIIADAVKAELAKQQPAAPLQGSAAPDPQTAPLDQKQASQQSQEQK